MYVISLVGGELLKDVKFAGDQGMVTQTEKGLQTIMYELTKNGKEYDLKINVKKTKDDETCTTEIKSRIAIAKNAFNKSRELLSKRLSKELKKKVIKTIVWSVALHRSETWTIRKR